MEFVQSCFNRAHFACGRVMYLLVQCSRVVAVAWGDLQLSRLNPGSRDVISCCKEVFLCGSMCFDVDECVELADVHSGACWLSPRHVGPIHCEVWSYCSPPGVALVLVAWWVVPAVDCIPEDPRAGPVLAVGPSGVVYSCARECGGEGVLDVVVEVDSATASWGRTGIFQRIAKYVVPKVAAGCVMCSSSSPRR